MQFSLHLVIPKRSNFLSTTERIERLKAEWREDLSVLGDLGEELTTEGTETTEDKKVGDRNVPPPLTSVPAQPDPSCHAVGLQGEGGCDLGEREMGEITLAKSAKGREEAR